MICPYCKEDIKDGAIKCKHCGSMLNDTNEINNQVEQIKVEEKKEIFTKSQEEKVFYDKGNIKITSSRFIVSGQTYSLSNISSVKMGRENHNMEAFVLMLAGLLSLVFVVGIFILALAVWLFYQKKYKVLITTSGGENDVLSMKDENTVRNIVEKLNDAIVYRG